MVDQELIEQHVDRIVVKPEAIEIVLVNETGHGPDVHDPGIATQRPSNSDPAIVITVPWTTTPTATTKGILHSPSPSPTMSAAEQDTLLTAIAKARAWVDDIVEGRIASFAEIAKHESKVERHIRLLAPLAFVSPTIISGIVDGVGPSVGVTELAKRMPYSWNNLENR